MIDITKDIQSMTAFRRNPGEFMKHLKYPRENGSPDVPTSAIDINRKQLRVTKRKRGTATDCNRSAPHSVCCLGAGGVIIDGKVVKTGRRIGDFSCDGRGLVYSSLSPISLSPISHSFSSRRLNGLTLLRCL
jgi:hypothetical protein